MNSFYKKLAFMCLVSLAANQAAHAMQIPSVWGWIKENPKTSMAIVAGSALITGVLCYFKRAKKAPVQSEQDLILKTLVVQLQQLDSSSRMPNMQQQVIQHSEADKKAVLEKLQEELIKHCGSNVWPIRKKLIRKAIVECQIHPDEIKTIAGDIVLRDAVLYSDIEFVRFLLSHGASARYVDSLLQSPLLHDAKTIEMAQLLINAGASVDAKNRHGESVLHKIAVNDDGRYELALITFYANNGASSEVVDVGGGTALMHQAIYSMDTDSVGEKMRLLINAGVPLDVRSNLVPYKDLTAAQLIKNRLEKDSFKHIGFYIPRVFISAVKERNQNLKNMLESHVSPDCAGVITAYLEDRARVDKDVQELEDAVDKKQLETLEAIPSLDPDED